MSDQWSLQELPDSEADIFIQWKGTNACFDFYCPCGEQSHFDGYFAYFVKCPHCGDVFEFGTRVMVRKVTETGGFEPVLMEP